MLKRKIKAVTAFFAAAVMVITATACADTAVALKTDGNEVLAGEYLQAQMMASNNAYSKFIELYPDVDTSAETFNPETYEIEGKIYNDWITDETINILKEYQAVNNLFDEAMLSLSDEKLSEIKASGNSNWNDDASGYFSQYGMNFKTFGEYYESLGIGKASVDKLMLINEKNSELFNYYYGENGVEAVDDAVLKAEYEKENVRARVLSIPIEDIEGNEVTDETEKAKIKELADSYSERIANGEKLAVISADYAKYLDELEHAANPDLEHDHDDEEETETPDDEDYDVVIKKGSGNVTDAVEAKLFEMEYNKPEVFEDDGTYFILIRLNFDERPELFEDSKESVLHELKDDEYDAKIAAAAESVTVEENEAAMNRYHIEKVNERNRKAAAN